MLYSQYGGGQNGVYMYINREKLDGSCSHFPRPFVNSSYVKYKVD